MSLSEKELNKLLELAKEAALAAGKIINSYRGKELQTNLKETGMSLGSQIVTEVDIKAEQKILEVLLPSIKEHDLGLLTEETTDDQSRFIKDYFWCIDPIDGTLPFSRNQSGYSTSIALVSREGEAILGVVYDPCEENLYYALKGLGAFKNDQPFEVKESSGDITFIDGPGGAVMQAISTIEKSPCIFYKKPKEIEGGGCLWDYAATSVIHNEAGGLNCDFSFKPLNLNSQSSLFLNHCGVIYSSGPSLEEVKTILSSK